MTAPVDNSLYADVQGLSSLKRDAKAASPQALREAARQFESLFTQMMLKSMRSATPQDSLFGSDQQEFYQDLFDTQMAGQLSRGKGLGLADMLVRQLMQSGGGAEGALPAGAAAEAAAAASAGSPVGKPTAAVPAGAGAPPYGVDAQARRDFVAGLMPAARKVAPELGIDPQTLVAHAALETGWGRAVPRTADGASSFNFFGIKAGEGWQGASTVARTKEFEQGREVARTERFRAYGSVEEGLRDYARLIGGNARYAPALNAGSDAAGYAHALQRGGYATDPAYAGKLAAVANQLKSEAAVPIQAADAV